MKSIRFIIATSIIILALSCSTKNLYSEQGEGILGGIKSWSQKMFSDKGKSKQADQTEEASKNKEERQQKEYSRDEMVEIVKDLLDREDEILMFVPSIKKETGEKDEFYYEVEGVKLEDIDNAALKKIFLKVRQEATRIWNDRMLRQMENIRLSQRTAAVARPNAVDVPRIPPSAPKIYTAPNIPNAPIPQPGQAVRIPSPPPASPRRNQ